MEREEFTENFWVLESKEVDLYFGMKCGKGHYWVGIDSAVHFATKEDAAKMKTILERDFNLTFTHEPVEHGYFDEVVNRRVKSWKKESETNLEFFEAAADLIKHWPLLNSAEFESYRDRFMKAYKISEIKKGDKFTARF